MVGKLHIYSFREKPGVAGSLYFLGGKLAPTVLLQLKQFRVQLDNHNEYSEDVAAH